MEARGYTRSDNPDLVINFKGQLEEKIDIESTPGAVLRSGLGLRRLVRRAVWRLAVAPR